MGELREEIHELEALAFDSVINRDYELSSYYYYWLLKEIEWSDNKDLNSENHKFYTFYYYICSKLQENWIVRNNDFHLNFLVPIIICYNKKSKIDEQFQLELFRMNAFIANNYNSILYSYKSLKHIMELVSLMIEEYIAPKSQFVLNEFFLFYQIFETITIYKNKTWSHVNISSRSINNSKNKQLDDVIAIVLSFLPDSTNPGNYLFRLTSLYYLKGTVQYLLNVIMFLKNFNNNLEEFEKLDSNLRKTKRIFQSALDLFPINYQMFQALEFIENALSENHLYSNNLYHSLEFCSSSGFLNDGSELNNNKKFNDAEQCYNQGLNRSLLGDKYRLYYNLAKNYQDLLYEAAPSDINRNLYADDSIKYARLSLFDYNLSLMRIFSLNSIIINDNYYEVRNSSQCFNLIGITHSKMNNNNVAIKAYSSALSFWENNYDKNSEIGDIYSNRALSYLRIKEYDKSIEDSQTALFHKPRKPVSALLNIAYCYFQKQNYNTALKYYDRILGISNDNIELGNTYHSMGLSYFNMGKRDDAIDCFKNALQYNKNDLINYKLIGQAYRKSGNIIEAEKFFLEAVNSKVIDAYFDLGDMFSGEKQDDKAKMYFNHYLAESRKRYYNSIRNYNDDFFKNSVFYKYKSINKFTFESLINNYVYLSDIAGLNDPFDCRLIYEMNKNAYLREVFEDAGMPKIMSMSLPIEQDQLLWSHYADEHKGVRIGYSFTKEFFVNNNIIFSPIEYKDDVEINWMSPLLKITGALNDGEHEKKYYEIRPGTDVDLLKSIIVKSKNWEYENEIRLIAFDKDNKKFNNHEGGLFTIQNITFGCRTADDDIRTILTIFYNRYSNSAEFRIENNGFYNGDLKLIEFFKLRRSKDSLFTLDIDDVFSVDKYLI